MYFEAIEEQETKQEPTLAEGRKPVEV